MAVSPPEYCRLFAQKKAYQGGVTGTPRPPIATLLDMHMNETKFERNSSLGYYHMTCYWENKTYKLKRSILLWVLAKMIVIVTEASYQMLQVL